MSKKYANFLDVGKGAEKMQQRIAALETELAAERARADALAAALEALLSEWHEDAKAYEIVTARAALVAHRKARGE